MNVRVLRSGRGSLRFIASQKEGEGGLLDHVRSLGPDVAEADEVGLLPFFVLAHDFPPEVYELTGVP